VTRNRQAWLFHSGRCSALLSARLFPASQFLEALRILRLSKIANPGDADLNLYLLLTTGRLRELDAALKENPDLPKLLGPRFHWYNGMLAAARGNYQEADQLFEKALAAMPRASSPLATWLHSQTLARLAPEPARMVLHPFLRDQELQSRAAMASLLRETSEICLLRGLLALEQGDNAAARQHFQQCLEHVQDLPVGEPVARRYLDLLGAQ
jgi:tetratricopeptide (TPR) repeat protein